MKPYQRQFIEFALSKQVLKFGEFTLKSGRLRRLRSRLFFALYPSSHLRRGARSLTMMKSTKGANP